MTGGTGLDGHRSGLHLGRDEPELFWAPWVAQAAPGVTPSVMRDLDIQQYIACWETVSG